MKERKNPSNHDTPREPCNAALPKQAATLLHPRELFDKDVGKYHRYFKRAISNLHSQSSLNVAFRKPYSLGRRAVAMTPRSGSIVVNGNDVKVTTIFAHEHAVLDENATLDEKTLGALGDRQEFKRYVFCVPRQRSAQTFVLK